MNLKKTYLIPGAGALLLTALIIHVPFKVEPTERANVTRWGTIQHDKPLKPGLHWRRPIIDRVDKLQVSLSTIHIPAFDVFTVDNQKVTIDLNFNFTVPDEQVNHLLYEVGRSGNSDIDNQLIPVIKDRTGRIFSGQNMVSVNANRGSIQNQLEKDVQETVQSMFGTQVHSLQIAAITPSPAFMASNEEAVKAKNAAVAAENTKKTKQFEADQQVIKAKGDADSAIEAARGKAESTLLEAKAEQTRLKMEGEGRAALLKSEMEPFKSPELYIEYMKAKAAQNWNGQQPQIVAGQGANTNFIVPVPTSMQTTLSK